jgi:hypothetical protein
MLPVLGPYAKKVFFESPKYISVPLTLDPITEVDEKNLVEMRAQVLNQLFMTDLALGCPYNSPPYNSPPYNSSLFNSPP